MLTFVLWAVLAWATYKLGRVLGYLWYRSEREQYREVYRLYAAERRRRRSLRAAK